MEENGKYYRIKRNIRFWGRNAEIMMAMLGGFVCLYAIVFCGSSGQTLWESVAFYLLLCGVLFAYLQPVSMGSAYLPMILSFGAGRKESVWGMQFANLIFAFQIIAFETVCLIAAQIKTGVDIPAIGILAEATILCTAFGQLAGAAQLCCGKKGIGIWSAVGGTIAVMAIAILMEFRMNAAFFYEDMPGNFGAALKGLDGIVLIVGGVAAVGVYLLSVWLLQRIVLRYEVRR